jgi:hypothetical protein
LLALKLATALKPARIHFIAQTHMTVEARKSSSIHDRVIFLDDASGWVLSQSIKDTASKKPTYLAPLDAELTKLALPFRLFLRAKLRTMPERQT